MGDGSIMRIISVSKLKGDELLAKTIFDSENRVLLAAGCKIRTNYIPRMLELGICSVYVQDEISDDIVIEDFISEQTRQRSRKEVKKLLEGYIVSKKTDLSCVTACADNIIEDLLAKKEVSINVFDLRTKDEYTYAHSVNVCALAVATGINMGYNMLKIKELAVGAILHDLGKILVPQEVLNKPSKLTAEEFDIIKKHPKDGFDILKDEFNLSAISRNIILMHHEKCDGSGYPLNAHRDQIHELTKLVTICDVFDAMTADRPYRKGIKTKEVVEYINSLSKMHFEYDIAQSFIANIVLYPTGSGVILNDGRIGIVVNQNKSITSRPIVRIIKNENKEDLKSFYEIDLIKELTMYIVDTIDI